MRGWEGILTMRWKGESKLVEYGRALELQWRRGSSQKRFENPNDPRAFLVIRITKGNQTTQFHKSQLQFMWLRNGVALIRDDLKEDVASFEDFGETWLRFLFQEIK